MSQLIRLVYASRSVFEPAGTARGLDPAVARILAHSRKNNARHQIVGGLLFGEGCFLQCLEGEVQAVQKLYSKIEVDPRHRDVTVLSQSTIRQRGFDAWSMKYVPGEQRMQHLLTRWGMTRFDPYGLTKEQLDEAVRFMRDEVDAAADLPPAQPAPPHARAGAGAPRPAAARAPAPRAAASGATFTLVVGAVGLVCAAALAAVLLR